MVDLAKLPDLRPLACPTCNRILVAVPFTCNEGKRIFLYCNSYTCRYADVLTPDNADYAKIYKHGQQRIDRLQSQKRKWEK